MRKKLTSALVVGLSGLVLAGPAAAATGVKCRSDWANAFGPVVDTITGNSLGLFRLLILPIVIVVLILLALLSHTKHRSILTGILVTIVAVIVAILVAPGVINSLSGGICSG